HVEENHALGFRRRVRLLRRERIGKRRDAVGSDCLPGVKIVTQEASQGDASESAASLPEEFAPHAATEVGIHALFQIHKFVQIEGQQAKSPQRFVGGYAANLAFADELHAALDLSRGRRPLQNAPQDERYLIRGSTAHVLTYVAGQYSGL